MSSAGPSVSGAPCPRFSAPVRWASADISVKIVVPNGRRRFAIKSLVKAHADAGLVAAGGEREQLRALLGEPQTVVARDRRDRRDDERVGLRGVDHLPR